jgi:hypothetical protein
MKAVPSLNPINHHGGGSRHCVPARLSDFL